MTEMKRVGFKRDCKRDVAYRPRMVSFSFIFNLSRLGRGGGRGRDGG